MAKTTKTVEQGEVPTADERSAVINLDSFQGRAILSAWQGVYHLFGGQVEGWTITPEGVEATGFSVSGIYDAETIVRDIASRERRLDLLRTYPILMGEAPANFVDAADITAFTIQFYKGSVDEGSARTPAYVKSATAAYKSANALAKKRGPKAKIFRLDNLDSLDESVLSNVSPDNLAKLQATLERVIMANSNKNSTPMVEATI